MDLFEHSSEELGESTRPLAERLRPKTLSDFLGQSKSVGQNSILMKSVLQKKRVPNLIIWGPPGTGKTSFGRLLSKEVDGEYCN